MVVEFGLHKFAFFEVEGVEGGVVQVKSISNVLEITTSFLSFPLDDETLGDFKLCHSTPIH
jgi:hypothetical protein